jgi:hypothetical protein
MIALHAARNVYSANPNATLNQYCDGVPPALLAQNNRDMLSLCLSLSLARARSRSHTLHPLTALFLVFLPLCVCARMPACLCAHACACTCMAMCVHVYVFMCVYECGGGVLCGWLCRCGYACGSVHVRVHVRVRAHACTCPCFHACCQFKELKAGLCALPAGVVDVAKVGQ